MMYDVVSIGSAVQDTFLQSRDFVVMKSKKFTTGLGECFSYGSKVEVNDLTTDIGGGATNTSVTFANLGFKTGIFSYVGNDLPGQVVTNAMVEYGVDTLLLHLHHKLKTGQSIILMTRTGDRTILVYRGAATAFSAQDLHPNTLKTKWIYLSSVAGNIAFVKSLLTFAEKHKIRVAWNPGRAELDLGLKVLRPLMKRVDVVILNCEEAALLGSCAVNEPKQMFTKLKACGKTALAISAGSRGAYMRGSDGKILFAKSVDVNIVNTTGAGDAFGSGLVAGLMMKDDVEYALKVGMANSQSVIQKMGAKNGLIEKVPHPLMRRTKIDKVGVCK